MSLRFRRIVVPLEFLAGAGVAAFAVHGVIADTGRLSWFVNYPVYYAVVALAALLAVGRAVLVARDRLAWIALALAVTCYALGEFGWLALFAHDPDPPYPSIVDAFYLSFYAFSYVGLVLLLRSRMRGVTAGLWLDGVTAALAAAALGSAIVIEVILDTTDGPRSTVATNLAYPLGDILLLALVIAAFSLLRWRPGRAWLLIGLALAVFAVGDSVYLYTTATGSYADGGLLDAAWPAALVLVGAAGWHEGANRRAIDTSGRPLLAVPAVCGAIAAGILAVDHWTRFNVLAVTLALLTLVAILIRLTLVFRENRVLLDRTRREAVTDPVTGLCNRRKLMTDLEPALASVGESSLLVIFDLDGFKGYNDSFGHPAGDSLLARLGEKLRAAQPLPEAAYRLGGDEFCVLVPIADADGVGRVIDDSLAALSEHGEGFDVTSSFGAVVVPDDAGDAVEALRIADERLYAQKHSKRASRERPHETLLQALYEREPDLHGHLESVAELAVEIARTYPLPQGEVELIQRAAQLHDVGKIAIPDDILRKPGPLTDEEWVFVRRHTVVGERILTASPALRQVARVVRATHERWDGQGYPDGLSGEEIPLAARIIVVCDAYHAMITTRPYREAMPGSEALAELRRCAGTQFDPDVVGRFASVLSSRTTAAA